MQLQTPIGQVFAKGEEGLCLSADWAYGVWFCFGSPPPFLPNPQPLPSYWEWNHHLDAGDRTEAWWAKDWWNVLVHVARNFRLLIREKVQGISFTKPLGVWEERSTGRWVYCESRVETDRGLDARGPRRQIFWGLNSICGLVPSKLFPGNASGLSHPSCPTSPHPEQRKVQCEEVQMVKPLKEIFLCPYWHEENSTWRQLVT